MTSNTRVQNWQDITIGEDQTFGQALKIINEGGYQLALIKREDGRLAGMVTDSDIRKALLNGISLDKKITEVMNSAPMVVTAEIGDSEANNLMKANHFFHLPIIDNTGTIIGLHVAEQLTKMTERKESLVIMAGGKGSRLMPLTEKLPKPMLPVKGKPIIEHIIDRARLEGFSEIIISVNYLAEIIIEYFGDGKNHGVNIQYIHEDRPLGTAGALAQLPEKAKETTILVTNADLMTDVSYADLLQDSYIKHAHGMMAVRFEEWQSPFGVVRAQGSKLLAIEEKPVVYHQVNAGIYALTPSLINLIEPNCYCDMTELFTSGLKHGLDLHVYPIHESWIDVGRMIDYERITA